MALARTVLEGLNDLGVSGLALSPSGQDADCLIRGFFCGHRHLANVRAMVDAYWNDDEVGVRSWPGMFPYLFLDCSLLLVMVVCMIYL